MSSPPFNDLGLHGLSLVLSPSELWSNTNMDEVIGDMEGEQETMFPYETTTVDNQTIISQPGDGLDEDDNDENTGDTDSRELKDSIKFETIKKAVADASRGVTDKTDSEYRGQMNLCVTFLRKHKLIREDEEFFCTTPRSDAPQLIVVWIMDGCDEINPFDGSKKPSDIVRGSYSHAQKMRAAVTYGFGRLCGLGSLPWHSSEVSERMLGNPSVSSLVSSYMLSLHRRKVRAGETPTSARAITSDVIRKMYIFNNCDRRNVIKAFTGPVPRGTKSLHNWGGARTRLLLQAVYTLAFMCMLRFDEVLKIQAHHIKIDCEKNIVQLSLPFRKTHQFGDEAHLCPVRALAMWLKTSRVNEGYIFRRIMSGDRISTTNSPMITMPTGLIHFDEEDASILHLIDAGLCEEYVNGEGGAPSSTI
ncbi:hypothetical protein H0H92_001351 [Tricholoma furcatifolium]|nr:hypothetical protein H0H92_001351 [Tricholoma furcatifolium]